MDYPEDERAEIGWEEGGEADFKSTTETWRGAWECVGKVGRGGSGDLSVSLSWETLGGW